MDLTIFFQEHSKTRIALELISITIAVLCLFLWIIVITSGAKHFHRILLSLLRSFLLADFMVAFMQALRPLTFLLDKLARFQGEYYHVRRCIEIGLSRSYINSVILNIFVIIAVYVLLPLRYRGYVNRYVSWIVLAVWACSFALGFSCFCIALWEKWFGEIEVSYIRLTENCYIFT